MKMGHQTKLACSLQKPQLATILLLADGLC